MVVFFFLCPNSSLIDVARAYVGPSLRTFVYRPCMIGPTKKGPLVYHVLRHCCIGIFLDSSYT